MYVSSWPVLNQQPTSCKEMVILKAYECSSRHARSWVDFPFPYCWRKISCTTWDVLKNLANNGINYLSTGAGFLPSTAVSTQPSLSPENMCEMIPKNLGTVGFHSVMMYSSKIPCGNTLRETNSSSLKIHGWKISFPFRKAYFQVLCQFWGPRCWAPRFPSKIL